MNETEQVIRKALHILLGRYWKERLLRAMKDASNTKPPKRRRRNTPEELARRRKQMIEMNEQRARMKQDMMDPCLSADDERDALRMFAEGKTAAEIHEYLGGGLGWWMRWYYDRIHND
jgi:hypothetical protein